MSVTFYIIKVFFHVVIALSLLTRENLNQWHIKETVEQRKTPDNVFFSWNNETKMARLALR